MKYVFPNYSRQLISVCFLLNPKIPISQHRKHLPSLVINLSYVNEAGVVEQLFFFWMLSKALLEKQLTRVPTQNDAFVCSKDCSRPKAERICTLCRSRTARASGRLGARVEETTLMLAGPGMAMTPAQCSALYREHAQKSHLGESTFMI